MTATATAAATTTVRRQPAPRSQISVASMSPQSQRRLRDVLLGPPRDPMAPDTRKHMALAAFLAWIGIGADGLSSSAYGPAEAFIALGTHSQLALYLAVATAFTVFVISLAYNQVIELFPNGGGGYKVATRLVGPYAGLVAGSALVVDYVLTIAISVASGVDALFSLLPPAHQLVKLEVQLAIVVLLIYLNLRGMRESIRVLAPIFVGFVITHFFLIAYGIVAHGPALRAEIDLTIRETHDLAGQAGAFFVVALFLKAYSLGGGTYTGIEAVSNNVNMLKEPRVRTGKWTMFLMALSLSITAGGIILLYLLWDVQPSHTGQTLNAVVFGDIIDNLGLNGSTSHALLICVLVFEGALLFVAANTGFLGGPAVLANMAVDRWAPNQFASLSSRLVTRNGILLMGVAALAILSWTRGYVALLVVLYTVNVFITFTLSLLGLTIYWWRQRRDDELARRRLVLSASALLITASILVVIIIERFLQGGIVTLFITSVVVAGGVLIRRHYARVRGLAQNLERTHPWRIRELPGEPPAARSCRADRRVPGEREPRRRRAHGQPRAWRCSRITSATWCSSASARWIATRSAASRRSGPCSTRPARRSMASSTTRTCSATGRAGSMPTATTAWWSLSGWRSRCATSSRTACSSRAGWCSSTSTGGTAGCTTTRRLPCSAS